MQKNSTIELKISGMTCTACSNRVEKKLNSLPDTSAVVNLTSEVARVTFSPKNIQLSQLIQAVRAAGYDAALLQRNEKKDYSAKLDAGLFVFSFLLTLPFWITMILHLLQIEVELNAFSQFILATLVQFIPGFRYLRGTFYSFKNFSLNMDVLVTMGTLSAYFYSLYLMILKPGEHLYFEASASIITFVLLGKILESRARHSTRSAIEALIASFPEIAHVEKNGNIEDLETSQVKINDLVHIRQGEVIPVDGIVVSGTASIDESMLTGEPMPSAKTPGRQVFAGTLNLSGSLVVRSEKEATESVISEVIKKVEMSMASKPKIQKLADKISQIFVPFVVTVSLLVFLILYFSGSSLEESLLRAVSVLVVSCPCALGLAVPTAVAVAMGAGAVNGILFRNAEALEHSSEIKNFAFDKTGTLSTGKLKVMEVNGFSIGKDELLRISAALEHGSTHPIARAIRAAAQNIQIPPVDNFQEVAGMGASGQINGDPYYIGNAEWLMQQNISINLPNEYSGYRILISDARQVIGVLTFQDELRHEASEVVESLKKMSIIPVLLSGDEQNKAELIGKSLGIEKVFGHLKPVDKADKIEELKKSGAVAMVGDGINDAPALASADISFAMGTGSAMAIEASDVTLQNADLKKIITAIEFSKATIRKIKQNFFFAFAYNVIAIPAAAMGYLSPAIAAAAMALSSVSVSLSSLHLKVVLKKILR
ncbi:MAG: cadmium-translocating P-type ATPase [Leptospiraceae bacterium]|nr:cadmium-translocating P-type ATPase [Leptospiraceae bacterium]